MLTILLSSCDSFHFAFIVCIIVMYLQSSPPHISSFDYHNEKHSIDPSLAGAQVDQAGCQLPPLPRHPRRIMTPPANVRPIRSVQGLVLMILMDVPFSVVYLLSSSKRRDGRVGIKEEG